MSTNYYTYLDVCEHCGRAAEKLHIGKSSFGWCFSLHVIPERGLNSLDDWMKFLENKLIKNEYDEEVSLNELRDIIIERARSEKIGVMDFPNDFYISEQQMLDMNHAEKSPFNILRHKIGDFCIGHGDGTWDLLKGEFS